MVQLTPAQNRVLSVYLREVGIFGIARISMKKVADELGLHLVTVTYHVDALRAKGILQRIPDRVGIMWVNVKAAKSVEVSNAKAKRRVKEKENRDPNRWTMWLTKTI